MVGRLCFTFLSTRATDPDRGAPTKEDTKMDEKQMTHAQFLDYLGEILNHDPDVINTAEVEADPGYVYVRTHTGTEFIIKVEKI